MLDIRTTTFSQLYAYVSDIKPVAGRMLLDRAINSAMRIAN